MMDVYDLLLSISQALAADAELSALAANWYGLPHRVYIDQDPDNPPGENDCPCIQIHSPEKQAAEQSRTVNYGLYLDIQVCEPQDRTRPEDNAEEFAATGRLAAFVSRAVAVVRAAKPAGFVMAFEYATDTVTLFPVFTADVYITFAEQLTIGQDPLG